MPLSSALHMSYTVSAATLAATSASISTPVSAVVFTLVAIETPFSHTRRVTAMCDSATGWHIGINSEVRFAAMIPAVRATSSGSPLGFSGSARKTSGLIATKALASASRAVRAFRDTSTMRAWPCAS